MNDPNITMEEYIRLEEEKARRRVFNDTLTSEAALSCEPTISSINDDEIDFRISFDESDDEDCTIIFDKNSFSYKIISVNDLKTDSENDDDKVNMPLFQSPKPTVSYFDDLDFFKDFENEFPAIVYNNAQTSKSDLLTEPISNPPHIDEFNLKDETSLSECDEEEKNILNFNDLVPFNVIYPDELKTDTDNDNDKVDIEHSSGVLPGRQPGMLFNFVIESVFPDFNTACLFYACGRRYQYGVSWGMDTAYDSDTVLGPRERKSTNIGGEFTNLEILKCWSLETSRRHGKVYNWETTTYGKIWDNEDVHDLGSVENEFPAIVFNDMLTSEAALSCGVGYDFLTEPTLSPQHIDEFNLNDETSLSECDEEEQNISIGVSSTPWIQHIDYLDVMRRYLQPQSIDVVIKWNIAYTEDLVKEISTNIGGEFKCLEIMKCWSLETSQEGCPVQHHNLLIISTWRNLSEQISGVFLFLILFTDSSLLVSYIHRGSL
ncbi:hypothetical protein Tco_0988100 [Tanacetum coccineum]|uniref:Uncharacterized protein n=1 Tax=Tanacetum coccineum TaxID=301880 RepID=A0ABQ5EQ01_9ASTR